MRIKNVPVLTTSFQMSDAASETMVEYALADMIYHVENEDNLPEF